MDFAQGDSKNLWEFLWKKKLWIVLSGEIFEVKDNEIKWEPVSMKTTDVIFEKIYTRKSFEMFIWVIASHQEIEAFKDSKKGRNSGWQQVRGIRNTKHKNIP